MKDDARIISAAPDMLKALEAIERAASDPKNGWEMLARGLLLVGPAIKKARGEEA